MLGRLLDALLTEAEIGVAAFTPEQHAMAMDRGEPLLFKGRDFGHTDVRLALERH